MRRAWRTLAMRVASPIAMFSRRIFDRPDNIPLIARRAARAFNFWKDAAHPRGLWRATSLDSFRSEAPEWDILLDLDALAAREREDWTWSGAATLPGSHDRAILMLSRGGADAVVLREFDLASRDFVADGFSLPEAKGGAAWLDRDTLLLSSAFGDGAATNSGYARTVRLWRRGTDPLAASIVFATGAEHMAVWADVDREADEERLVFAERLGFFDEIVWIGDRAGPKTRIDVPTDASVEWHRGWLAVKRRTPWTIGGETHPARHRPRHIACGVSRRRPPFHKALRTGRAPRPARVLLVRRPARSDDPR